LGRRLGGPQSQSGHSGEEKNSQPLPGLKLLITQRVAQCYTIELSWLLPNIIAVNKNHIPRKVFKVSDEIS
jgi:hypothetical protein